MEKSAKEVFNEIQTTINNLRAQLDELEDTLSKIPDQVRDEVEEDIPEAVVEPAESEDLEAQSADGGISRRAEREERCDDRKAPAGSEAEAACPLTGGCRAATGVKKGRRWLASVSPTKKAAGEAAFEWEILDSNQ